jgi:hypothetical protein
MSLIGALNLHVEPDTRITVRAQPHSSTVLLNNATAYPYVAVHFREVDDLRRLRDELDRYLVGRLGGEA